MFSKLAINRSNYQYIHNVRVQNQSLINWNDTSRITQMFAIRLYPSVVKIPYSAHICKKPYKMYAVIRK